METAEEYAHMILGNSRRAIRSAKETILDILVRNIDDSLRIESMNAYSCLGDFREARERLARFLGRGDQDR